MAEHRNNRIRLTPNPGERSWDAKYKTFANSTTSSIPMNKHRHPTRIRWTKQHGRRLWDGQYADWSIQIRTIGPDGWTWLAVDASRIIEPAPLCRPCATLAAAKRQASRVVRQFYREEHPNG